MGRDGADQRCIAGAEPAATVGWIAAINVLLGEIDDRGDCGSIRRHLQRLLHLIGLEYSAHHGLRVVVAGLNEMYEARVVAQRHHAGKVSGHMCLGGERPLLAAEAHLRAGRLTDAGRSNKPSASGCCPGLLEWLDAGHVQRFFDAWWQSVPGTPG